MRSLEEENTRLKQVAADLTLDTHMLAEARRKRPDSDTPPRVGPVVSDLIRGQCEARVSARRVHSDGLVPHRDRKGSDGPSDGVFTLTRVGASRICTLLRREGWHVNWKRVHRLYRLEGLPVRMRLRRRKHMEMIRGPAPIPTAAGRAGAWISSMMP